MLDRSAFSRASLPFALLAAAVLAVSIWQRWVIAAWVSGMVLSYSCYALWARQRVALDAELWREMQGLGDALDGGDDGGAAEHHVAAITQLEALITRAKSPLTRARVLEQIAWRSLRVGRIDEAVDAVSRLPPSSGASPVLYATLYVARGHVAEGKRLLERVLPSLAPGVERRWAELALREAEAALASASPEADG